jgi:hypothetical protein
MVQRIITVLICSVCIGCATKKNSVSPQQLDALHALVKSKNIHIVSRSALPTMSNAMQQVLNAQILGPGNSGRSIDIMSTVNYVNIIGDSISINLPYFGEMHSGISTNPNDISIAFNGEPIKYTSTYNNQKKNYKIRIDFKTKRERFKIYITLFSNRTTNIIVLPIHRSSIEYRGAVIKK